MTIKLLTMTRKLRVINRTALDHSDSYLAVYEVVSHSRRLQGGHASPMASRGRVEPGRRRAGGSTSISGPIVRRDDVARSRQQLRCSSHRRRRHAGSCLFGAGGWQGRRCGAERARAADILRNADIDAERMRRIDVRPDVGPGLCAVCSQDHVPARPDPLRSSRRNRPRLPCSLTEPSASGDPAGTGPAFRRPPDPSPIRRTLSTDSRFGCRYAG